MLAFFEVFSCLFPLPLHFPEPSQLCGRYLPPNERGLATATARPSLPPSTSSRTCEREPAGPGLRHLPAWVQMSLFGLHPQRPSAPIRVITPFPVGACS